MEPRALYRVRIRLILAYSKACLSFSYDFIFDRIMCVLGRIKVRGHCHTVHESH